MRYMLWEICVILSYNLDSILKSRDITLPIGLSSQGCFIQWSCMNVRVGL